LEPVLCGVPVPALTLRLTCNCSFGISKPYFAKGLQEGRVQRGKSLESGVAGHAAVVCVILSAIGTSLSPVMAAGHKAAQPRIQIAESNSSGERQPGVGMDPVLEAKLDEATAAYKKLATADVDSLVANCEKMLAAVQANDIPAARQAWIDARANYERSEIFTIKFPFLDAAIDSWPNNETGFHGVEAKLFTPGAPAPLVETQTLVDKVHTLQKVFNGEPLYAHGVIVGIGSLAFELGEGKAQGGESAISGTSLADMQHNVEGLELAWNTVFAATMQQKNQGVADRVEKEIAEVKQLVSVASLTQVDSQKLEAKAEMLAGSVSDAAVELGWPAPDFTDAD
jgi:iron uptake system component EfeO